jgi:hypothetical protein
MLSFFKHAIISCFRKHLIRELWLNVCMMMLRHILVVLCEMLSWPAGLSDLKPLDFYMWTPKPLNPLMHAAPVDTEKALYRSIMVACGTLRIHLAISEPCSGP